MFNRTLVLLLTVLFIIVIIHNANKSSPPAEIKVEDIEITKEDEQLIRTLCDGVYDGKLYMKPGTSCGFEYDFEKKELWSTRASNGERRVWVPGENIPFGVWCIIIFVKYKESGRPKPRVFLGKPDDPEMIAALKDLEAAGSQGTPASQPTP